MIPIKEAISSGAWLHCEYTYGERLCQFRVKVLSFEKFNLSDVDRPERIGNIDLGGSFWLMKMECINLNKEPIPAYNGPGKLKLIDQDGFIFPIFSDSHLRYSSSFAERTKMNRYYQEYLNPKMKSVGAIPFQLPDDNEAVYSILLENDGSIREA